MIDKNYAKLETGISSPQWLRLPIRLVNDITIEGITHSAGSYLSTNTESVLRELGYKPVMRTPKPTPETEGHDYRETWTDDGTNIVQGWESYEIQASVTDYMDALRVLGVNI